MTAAATQSVFSFPLAITPAVGRVHEPAAWFIAGDDPARWLAEMTGWNVSLVGARLFVLPTGINHPQVCGVLVILKGEKPMVVSALAYASLGERLYFPADANLDPVLSADELPGKLLWDVSVLHPVAGLVGFRDEDAISIESLIAPPPRRGADWSHAHPGIADRPKLVSVMGEAPPSIQQIIEMGRDDIGSEAVDEVPPAPDESPVRNAIGNAVNAGLRPLAAGLLRLMAFTSSLIPGRPISGRPPGKVASGGAVRPARQPGAFARWLAQKIGSMAAASQDLRNREINRLLGLLRSDPDMGLQYALPLTALATRGLAPPSNSLDRRSVDFSLHGLFGGNRPGDTWSVPDDLRAQLRQRYREAANRELNLGRFSRAAYIFAHLLGDFTAAADALKRARSFREAALIYKEKLNNPKSAADCMVEGGLILEAIPLYESLHLYETAGDLHARLGQADEAKACYRKAVGLLVSQHNVLAAARLVEVKIGEPDDALDMLAGTWPDSDSAGLCLREWFALAGRLGRHEAALRRVGELGEMPLGSTRIATLVENFSVVSTAYPNHGVRARAADSARVIAGHRLAVASESERQTLIKHITATVPADRLLARDGNRFLSKPKPKPVQLLIPFKANGPTIARSFRLNSNYDWQTVVAIPAGFLAFGTRGVTSSMVRGTWDGRMQEVPSQDFTPATGYLLIPPGHGAPAMLARFGYEFRHPFTKANFPRLDVFLDGISVDSPAFIDADCLGICREENGTTWVLYHEGAGQLVLKAHAPAGTLLASHHLAPPVKVSPSADRPIPMAARRGSVFIAMGNQLVRFASAVSESTLIELPFPIRTLTPAPAHTVTRMIATFEDGCALVLDSGTDRRLAQGLQNPVAIFTPDGAMVVVGNNGGHVYRYKSGELVLFSSFETNRKPLTVLPAIHGEFALLDATGTMDIWRLGSI